MKAAVRKIAREVLPEGLYRRYRRWHLRRKVAAFPNRVVEHRYGERTLKIALEDGLAAGWYDHDWDLPPELQVLRGRIPNDGLLFDLGAHQAVVALMACQIVPDGRVVAVEAEPHNARVASRNVALNDAQVELIHAAVSDRAEAVLFAEALNGRMMPGKSAGKVKLPAVTIDELARSHGHPSAVLIDIEGAEELALRGAPETLLRGTVFLIEVHVGCGLEDLGGSAGEILELLDGYELLSLVGEDWVPVEGRIEERTFLLAVPRRPVNSA